MIRINITDKAEYSRLREEFLHRIYKYVRFNKEDIVAGITPDERAGRGKENSDLTSLTAGELKEKYQNLYNYLFDKDSNKVIRENLQYLLAGPEEMPKSFGGIGQLTMQECFENIIEACQFPENQEEQEAAKKCCKEIFDYDKFVEKQEDAYWLLRNLHVRVCPYCNQIYTVTLPSREELKKGETFKTTRATFDHFYAKSDHPYFAVSLFNLVPSCGVCNSNKSNKIEEIVYPYDQEFGKEAVFRLVPDFSQEARQQNPYILNFLHGESDLFYIKFMGKESILLNEKAPLEERLFDIEDVALRKRIINSIRMFKLEEIYREHKQEIKDILRNRHYFDKQYVKTEICPMLRRTIKAHEETEDKQVSDDDIDKMAKDMLYFSRLRQKEWGQRPLSKLISDILEQEFEI